MINKIVVDAIKQLIIEDNRNEINYKFKEMKLKYRIGRLIVAHQLEIKLLSKTLKKDGVIRGETYYRNCKRAYLYVEDNKIDIYVIDVGSGMPVQLTADQGDNEDPSWSPDGSMITFTSTRNGGVPRIFVMNASGSDQRQLLKIKGGQTQPSWSGPIP